MVHQHVVIPSVGVLINKVISYLYIWIGGVVLYSILYNSLCSQSLSLTKFNTLYEEKYKATLEPSWLEWFIGFSEGDGYLGTFNDKLMFVLTQKESKILYHIKDTLKFGQVKEFDGFYRYIVSAQSDIFLLMNLFNGNLHLVPRIDQLVEWGNWWNVKFPENLINIITTPLKLSFNSGWLSGFIDAEGCFNIYIPKNSVFSVSIPLPSLLWVPSKS